MAHGEARRCRNCGAAFIRDAQHVWYCSNDCQRAARRGRDRIGQQVRRRGSKPLTGCPVCGSYDVLAYDGTFCSEAHFVGYWRLRLGDNRMSAEDIVYAERFVHDLNVLRK